jgi:hypothetical protein
VKRVFVALLLLAASCGRPEASEQTSKADPRAPERLVDCAIRGSATFEHVCTIDRRAGADGQILTIRAPDGGFRRFLVRSDGTGISAADGAEPVRVGATHDGVVDVAVGGDRYRLPARG